MSEEIPDRKQWVIQIKSYDKKAWAEFAGRNSLESAISHLKGYRERSPERTFRIIEQTISSKVVEG